MSYLYDELKQYKELNIYPFHMPGHKRAGMGQMPQSFCQMDISEIEGFDNLHCAEGLLLEAQERAAGLYDSSETLFVVNGSTGSILSAVSGVVKRGGTVLVARNCHKSVYHSMFLNELEAIYLYPRQEEIYGLNGSIFPEDVKQALEKNSSIQAIIITSPTFDGVVSDIKTIAETAHAYNIPLIVDEAHGAHFGFHKDFPDSSVHAGADIVVHSLHKTLPAPTQTSLVHLNGGLIDREQIKKYLQIFQSSSPSYPLLAGMDECIRLMEHKKDVLFSEFTDRLSWFYTVSADRRNIKLVQKQEMSRKHIYDFDKSRLILSVRGTDMTGHKLFRSLLDDHSIHMEMAAAEYCLGISSIADSMDGFCRLDIALMEIDDSLFGSKKKNNEIKLMPMKAICSIAEAEYKEKKRISFEECEGKISGEYIYCYPPGIPFVVPGEILTKECIAMVKQSRKDGLNVQGMTDITGKTIMTVI